MKTMIRACPFRCGLLLLGVLLASPGHAADTLDSEGPLVSFFYDGRGRIDRLTIPLEGAVADIAFPRQPRPEIGARAALAGLIRARQRASAQEARSTAAGPSTRHEEAPYDVVMLGGRIV